MKLVAGDSEYPLEGVLELRWLPSPAIAHRSWSDDASRLDSILSYPEPGAVRPDTAIWVPPPSELPPPPDAPTYYTEGITGRVKLDQSDRPDRIQALLVNMPPFVRGGPEHKLLTDAALEVTLSAGLSAEDDWRGASQQAGYAVTHSVAIRAVDGRVSPSQLTRELKHLRMLLSFARGAWVGVALPLLYSGGRVVGGEWSVTNVDRASYRLSWLDSHCPEQLEELHRAMGVVRRDEYLYRVVGRAVAYYVTANNGSPVDMALVASQAGLELLSWAHIVELTGTVPRDEVDRLSAASRINLMLHGLAIPSGLPADFNQLAEYSGTEIGPVAVTKVRNDVTHPTRVDERTDDGYQLEYDAKVQAWRLSQHYFELAILALCGYSGTFGSRLNQDGRWAGEVSPVPWAD